MYLFQKGRQVNTLGTYRATLSSTLPKIEGANIGLHPVIIDLFKGFTNLRPREYKNPPRWEVDMVLETIHSWGMNESLSLKALTIKLVMLLALTSASRCGELSSLDVDHMTTLPDGVRFTLTKHRKNRRSSVMPGMLFFPAISDNPALCPCVCLKAYVDRTRPLRQKEHGVLFRSYIKPYEPVSSATISRWLTEVIKLSGTDLGLGSSLGHSVRGKSASKAKYLGLSTAQIMATAEWRSQSVFKHHYYHPQFNPNFGKLVLSGKCFENE